MGYQIKKHDAYIITGLTGKEYKIPAPIDMNVDSIEIVLRYNKETDELAKTQICKEFFLHFAPDLEDEGLSDMEYFHIFQDYNKGGIGPKKELGES